MNIHIPSQYTFSYNHAQKSLVCTNRFGEVEGVYPKTHPTEFMNTKGVQLASLITRESTTEQSLGGNAADLVGWASQDTHGNSN
jgi:hypothetical protein